MKKYIVFLSLTVFLHYNLFSSEKKATGSGKWSDSLIWGGSIPSNSDNISINSGVTITMDADYTTSGTLTILGTGEIAMAGKNLKVGNLMASGNAIISSTSMCNLTIGSPVGTSSYSGIIKTNINLIKVGACTLTLSGVNTYLGSTTISAGTIKLGGISGTVIPDGSSVIVDGTLDMAGKSETIGSLSGLGIVDNKSSGGTYVLTVGGNNSNTFFSGIFKNSIGNLALVKTGTGIMTISGISSNKGSITINNGIVRLGTSDIISDLSALIIESPGILDLNGQNETILSLSGNGTIDNISGGGESILIIGNDFSPTIFS